MENRPDQTAVGLETRNTLNCNIRRILASLRERSISHDEPPVCSRVVGRVVTAVLHNVLFLRDGPIPQDRGILHVLAEIHLLNAIMRFAFPVPNPVVEPEFGRR